MFDAGSSVVTVNSVSNAIKLLERYRIIKLDAYFLTACLLYSELDNKDIPYTYEQINKWEHVFYLDRNK